MAKLANESIVIPTNYRDPAWEKKEDRAIEKVATECRSKNPGEFVGEEISFQVADGYARYLVTSQEPLELAHLQVGDGYQVHPALIKGLDIDDVREQVRRRNAIKEMFAESAAKKSAQKAAQDDPSGPSL